MPYPDIAKAFGLQEATCRKLVSRARANIDRSTVRHVTPVERQEELLAAFEVAVASGRTDRLAALLSDDIALCADGGGKVPTIRRVLRGKAEVLAFIAENLRAYWSAYGWTASDINGGKGVIVHKDGVTAASVSFAFNEAGQATNIYIMRNPDKLARLSVAGG